MNQHWRNVWDRSSIKDLEMRRASLDVGGEDSCVVTRRNRGEWRRGAWHSDYRTISWVDIERTLIVVPYPEYSPNATDIPADSPGPTVSSCPMKRTLPIVLWPVVWYPN